MNTIDSIIKGELRPFIQDLKGNDYYEPEFIALTEEQAMFIDHYQIDFGLSPFTSKVKYYCKLITNSVIQQLNDLYSTLVGGSEDRIAYYHKKLKQKTKTDLNKITNIIDEHHLFLSQLECDGVDYRIDTAHKENAYILNYLKTSLIYQLLEFQAIFKDKIDTNKSLDITQIYIEFLGVNPPKNTRLKEVSHIEPITIKQHQSTTKKNTTSQKSFGLRLHEDKQNPLLLSLYDSLQKKDLIECTYQSFKLLFTERKITEKVKWKGTNGSLRWLIRQLDELGILIYKQNAMWETACFCFIDKDKKLFEKNQLRSSKTSQNDKELIDPIIVFAADKLK